MGHTGLVSKSVSNKNAIRMFRMFPFQGDGFQVWLTNSEIPWGTGYFSEVQFWREKGGEKIYQVIKSKMQAVHKEIFGIDGINGTD